LQAAGFAPWSDLVEIRSEVPVRVAVTLGVAPVTTQVQVKDSATLVDPYSIGTLYSIGRQTIEERDAAQPGRELLDLVSEQPGWVFEANGVLHPRGSEYDVQFVVDGLPLTQNRSPAFAPSFDAGEVESLPVLTASFPAEYGRKLGGVVEVTTKKDVPAGWHGRLDAGGGSFLTVNGAAGVSYAQGANRFSANAQGFHTERYLDPPVLANYTNRGNAAGSRLPTNGFLGERPIACKRDAQRDPLSGAQRACTATSRPATGYSEHRDKWTDLFSAYDFA